MVRYAVYVYPTADGYIVDLPEPLRPVHAKIVASLNKARSLDADVVQAIVAHHTGQQPGAISVRLATDIDAVEWRQRLRYERYVLSKIGQYERANRET